LLSNPQPSGDVKKSGKRVMMSKRTGRKIDRRCAYFNPSCY
jgi:hypothetical protein